MFFLSFLFFVNVRKRICCWMEWDKGFGDNICHVFCRLKNCVNLVWWVKLEYTVVDIQKSGITWESFNWQLSKRKSRVIQWIYNANETAMNSIWKSNTLDSLIFCLFIRVSSIHYSTWHVECLKSSSVSHYISLGTKNKSTFLCTILAIQNYQYDIMSLMQSLAHTVQYFLLW